jgi:hypothetical protein
VQEKLQIAADKRDTLIQNKCGNRGPAASVPFCCRTMGNMCMAAATREDCETGGGTVQENKFCDVDNTCSNPPGGQKLTWWEFCPESPSCPGMPLSTNDDIKTCVGTAAEAIVDELLCWQFPGNGGADWPCPPPDGSASGAFVDGLQLFF